MPKMKTCRVVWGTDQTTLIFIGVANDQPLPLSRPMSPYDIGWEARQNTHTLCSVMGELTIFHIGKMDFSMLDLFTRSILVSEPVEDRPFSAVFAARAFLDIKQIMGVDIHCGFHELNHFKDNLNKSFLLSKSEPTIANAKAEVTK